MTVQVTALAGQAVSYSYDASGNVTGLVGPNLPSNSALFNWKRSPASGKKIAWVGDSTTLQISPVAQGGTAGVDSYYTATYTTQVGSALYGTTNVYFGANGNSLYNFANNIGPAGFNLSDVIVAAPDLVILSYGINDVRLGTTTLAQLLVLLKSAVSALRTALPSCDIVLRMPNSFLTTDVGALGYVVPNGSAQAYTDILRNAYRTLANFWPNVVVYDAQSTAFPATCQATYLYMNDQLHPTVAGYKKIIDQIIPIIAPFYTSNAPFNTPFNQGQADDAQNASYHEAHLTYPRVVENGDYTLITSGAYVGQGSAYLDFSGDQGQIASIAPGDVVVQNGQAAFSIPYSGTAAVSGSNIRLGSLGAGNPTYAQTGGVVSVWRHKYVGNLASKPYVNDTGYPAKMPVLISLGGSNFIRIGTMTGQKDITNWNFKTTDTLLHPVLGVVALTGATFSMSGANIQINKGSTDFTTTYLQAMLVAQGAERPITQNLQTLYIDAPGLLATTTLTKALARGGLYGSVTAYLGTAGSVATTVVLAADGVTFATVTFAISATVGTVAWASGSSAQLRNSQKITAAITAGTLASDMSIVLDA